LAENAEQLEAIMSNDGNHMLLKMEFAPKNENGIYEHGFATAKSPNDYQSKQGIAEVFTVHGKGVPGFTTDEIGVPALPTGVSDDGLLRACTAGIHALSDHPPTLDTFEDAYNEHVNLMLSLAATRRMNSTMESTAHFLPSPVTPRTPPPLVPPAEAPMTITIVRDRTPEASPIAAAAANDIIDLVDADEAHEPNLPEVVIKEEPQPDIRQTTETARAGSPVPAASAGTGTTAAANKRSPKRRQPADANADPAKTSPTAAATPPKRRLNKKLVVDEDSDNESEQRDVELTPLALYAQARAALAEPDIDELPRKAATDNGDAASDPK